MWIAGLSRLCSFLCDVLITRRAKTASGRKRGWTCSRSGRSARRAGLREARFVILQDSHIDLVLFVVFLISLCEQAIVTAAGRLVQFYVLPATSLARSFLLRAVCAKTFSFLSFATVSNNQTNSPEVSMGSIAFVFVVHSMAFFFTAVRGNLCCND